MTFLWIGLAAVASFVAFFAYLVALGLKQRVEDNRKAKADLASTEPKRFLPRQFKPYVPPQHRRTEDPDRDTPSDPAS